MFPSHVVVVLRLFFDFVFFHRFNPVFFEQGLPFACRIQENGKKGIFDLTRKDVPYAI